MDKQAEELIETIENSPIYPFNIDELNDRLLIGKFDLLAEVKKKSFKKEQVNNLSYLNKVSEYLFVLRTNLTNCTLFADFRIIEICKLINKQREEINYETIEIEDYLGRFIYKSFSYEVRE